MSKEACMEIPGAGTFTIEEVTELLSRLHSDFLQFQSRRAYRQLINKEVDKQEKDYPAIVEIERKIDRTLYYEEQIVSDIITKRLGLFFKHEQDHYPSTNEIL
jgi:hypothetical protein